MVAVFLLHAGGFSGLRPGLPERDAFSAARGSESGGSVRHRPRRDRPEPRRHWSRSASRLRRSDADGQQLQVAGVRSGGHDPLVSSSSARNRTDQIDPATDHRRQHRLALSRRGQTQAEGVTRGRGYWSGFVAKFCDFRTAWIGRFPPFCDSPAVSGEALKATPIRTFAIADERGGPCPFAVAPR